MSDHKAGIEVYSSGITNLVTITAAGLAASTALMQIAGPDAGNKNWYLASLIFFFIGLICCFLTLSGLTGQAIDKNPSIDVLNIKLPALISFTLACIGFVLLGIGAFTTNGTKSEHFADITSVKLENCRNETNTTPDARIKCYDSFVDSYFADMKITESEIKGLSAKDQTWLKLMILKNKPAEK